MMDLKGRNVFTWLFAGNAFTRVMDKGEYLTDVGLFQFLVGGDGHVYWIEGGYDLNTSTFDNNNKSTYPSLKWFPSGGTWYQFGTQAYYDRIEYWRNVKTKWPHLRFHLTLRQDGSPAIFESLVKNYGNCQTNLVNDIRKLMNDFDYIDGMDYDFERLHGRGTADEVLAYAKVIYDVAKEKNLLVNWDLPPMQGPSDPSWEAWCDYSRFHNYFDTCVIMSYAFSWAGSSPAPIGPDWWMTETYDYAVTAIPKNKVHLGVGGFGFRWDITKLQTKYNDGTYDSYRGASGGMAAWKDWMNGYYSHTDGRGTRPTTNTQPYIPYAAFYDEESKCPYLYLHVYDYLYAHDKQDEAYNSNMAYSSNQGKKYATSYQKKQSWTDELFPQGIFASSTFGSASQTTGSFTKSTGGVTTKMPQDYIPPKLDADGYEICPGQQAIGQGVLTYTFTTEASADVVVRGLFPFFGRDRLVYSLDGVMMSTNFKWWDQARLSSRYFKLGRVDAGSHELKIYGPDGKGGGSDSGFTLYGITMAPTFVNTFSNSALRYNGLLRPLTGWKGTDAHTEANLQDVYPNQNKFILVAESLRRDPDYMPIWPDDWRYNSDWAQIAPYWDMYKDGTNLVRSVPVPDTPSNQCNVYMGKTTTAYDHAQAFSQLATGHLKTKTGVEALGFLKGLVADEPHIRVQFSMDSSVGNFGILVDVKDKDNHYMVQYSMASTAFAGLYGRVRLFKRVDGTYNALPITASNSARQVDSTTVACDLTSNIKTTCEVRVRNGIIKAYRGNTDSLGTGGVTSLFSYSAGTVSGSVGFRTNNSAVDINLFQLGHGNKYNPREKYSVLVKDQNGNVLTHQENIGKMDRTNVVYDDPVYGTFSIVGEYEEYQTRDVSISKEWDYFQSEEVQLPPGDYIVEYRPHDIGVWFSYMFLCDADGASIVYFNDNSTIISYINRAKYEWEVAGIGYWVFGNEDDSLYTLLPSHVQ